MFIHRIFLVERRSSFLFYIPSIDFKTEFDKESCFYYFVVYDLIGLFQDVGLGI